MGPCHDSSSTPHYRCRARSPSCQNRLSCLTPYCRQRPRQFDPTMPAELLDTLLSAASSPRWTKQCSDLRLAVGGIPQNRTTTRTIPLVNKDSRVARLFSVGDTQATTPLSIRHAFSNKSSDSIATLCRTQIAQPCEQQPEHS